MILITGLILVIKPVLACKKEDVKVIIKVGNLYYFLELIILSIIFIIIFMFLKKKDKNYQFKFLWIWCFLGFLLHFGKQLVYWNINDLHKSTLENICAVSTVVFPFIMKIRKKSVLHDFMFFIGILGGFAGIVYPTEAINEKMFCFETFRFYFCHFSLFAIPLFLALFNIHRPDLKKWWLIPVCFLGYELIICLNTAFLCFSGLVKREGYTAFQLFIDRNYLNNSFVFGPTDDMGKVGAFIGNLTLPIMKVDILNINNGKTTYWPVIWLTIPSYILFVPLYLLIAFPFSFKRKRNYLK